MLLASLQHLVSGSCRLIGFVAHIGRTVRLHWASLGSSRFVGFVAHIGGSISLHLGSAGGARLRASGARGSCCGGYFGCRSSRRAGAHLGGSGRGRLGLSTEATNEKQCCKKTKNALHG
jgi:hypothetical protein